MFRDMRRKRQLLSEEDTAYIMETGTAGVLAVQGDDDYPYAVPMSYVYLPGKIYFHAAKGGHKIDAVLQQPKASFCVIGQDLIVPEKYTTYYKSAIAFGRIRILSEETEIRMAIHALSLKYAPEDTEKNRQEMIERDWNPLCMFVLEIEHMTGKEAIELVNAHKTLR